MIESLLKRPFPKDRVHFRAGATDAKRNQGKAKNAIALAYIDARDVMDRLDEVVGNSNWEDSYTETPNGRVICTLRINFPGGGWISKSDGAGDTGTEGEKGAISDALKRAAVKFGVGRYLYAFPNTWYPCDEYNRFVSGTEFRFPEGATEKEWQLRQSRLINKEDMQNVLAAMLEGVSKNDDLQVKQVTGELSDDEKGYVWRLLSSRQQEVVRSLLSRSNAA